MRHKAQIVASIVTLLVTFSRADAQYVTPQMGGGQIGLANAPMKHADVTFDGVEIDVHVDDSVGTPTLVPLDDPFEFEPEQPWSVLMGKAYNFQYGWNPGGFISLPSSAWIWIEQVEATPGLEVYQRPPAQPSYEQIFGVDGSVWRWPGSMTHNVYAVARPQQDVFESTYRVYVGDETTGVELVNADDEPTYGSDIVTFQFSLDLIGDFDESGILDAPDIDALSEQVSMGDYDIEFDLNDDEVLSELDREFWIKELVGTLTGDADLNGAVEFADFLSLSSSFGEKAGWANGDFDGDQRVQFADFLLLSQSFGQTTQEIATVPEGSGSLPVVLLLSVVLLRRRTDYQP